MVKNINITVQLVQALLPHLPRFSEEEGDFYSVKRTDLINSLCQQADIETAIAENTVNLCEILLDSLATLKRDSLSEGEWCFVSFPAQLMALSVLTAMSDPDSSFFEYDFWNTHTVDNARKDQQRAVLKLIENKRVSVHSNQAAPPIRYIYVAWSIIKCDGKVLFHQREDTQKRHDKTAGDYGLVGGRVNQRDMNDFADSMADKLRILQSNQREKIKLALTETLKRELLEEVGLIYDQHYTFKLWRSLKPYQQAQGAAPNHALTEYFFDVYSIDLTLEGFCYLQQAVATNERLVWFSVDEMVSGKKSDGKIAYLRALYDDFDGDKALLEQALTQLSNSFQADYQFSQKKYAFILAKDLSAYFYQGVVGKEKPFNSDISASQLSLLLGLAAHQRGFELSERHVDVVALHPYGWIEVEKHSELSGELLALAECLQLDNLFIENVKDCYFRLSVDPDNLFFDYEYYTWSVDLESKEDNFIIFRKEIETLLGIVKSAVEHVSITTTIARNLKKIVDKQLRVDVYDSYRKSDAIRVVKQVGMSRLLKEVDGELKYFAQFVSAGETQTKE